MANGNLSPTERPPPFEIAAAPAPVDLRPLSTSELIDRGFTLYRANFAGFLLLALLCQTPPLLGQILVTTLKLDPSQSEFWDRPQTFFTKMGVITCVNLITMLIVFCFEVVITFFIADAYLGQIPSVIASMRKFATCSLGALWTCLLNWLCVGFTLLFPFIAIAVIYFYLLFHPPLDFIPILVFTGVSLVFLVASFAPVLIVFMRLMVTIPALVLEGLAGWKAIRRSSMLVRYDPGLGLLYWGEMRLSFLLLPLFIIELLILSLTSLPLTLHQLGEVMRHGSAEQISTPPDSTIIISQILTFLAGSFILPLYPIATTLFYYDIRIRREGFDLEFMAAQLEGQP